MDPLNWKEAPDSPGQWFKMREGWRFPATVEVVDVGGGILSEFTKGRWWGTGVEAGTRWAKAPSAPLP
jgi:hypothetical protein